jgi:hypothetical protein
MRKPTKSRTAQRASKKKAGSGRKKTRIGPAKKRAAPKANPPPQGGWETPDTTNELLLGRAAVRRRQFEAAMQPAQDGVFAPVPPSATSTAPTATLLAIGRHKELLARNSEVEATIAQLGEAETPGIGHNRPPLTSDEIAEIRELLVRIRGTPTAPPTQPTPENKETANKLKSFAAKVGDWCKGKADVIAVGVAAKFADQLWELIKAFSNWLFSGGEPPPDFFE